MVSMSEINKHQTPRDTHTHPKKHTEIDSARLVTPPAELLGTRRSGFILDKCDQQTNAICVPAARLVNR